MSKLKPCPCGKTPTELSISDAGQGGKWANACGDCCGDWTVEFRTQFRSLNSNECMALAISDWNDAPRIDLDKALEEQSDKEAAYYDSFAALCKEEDKVECLENALKELVHLHHCEMEGIGSGMPSPDDWIKAVDNAEKALLITGADE